MHHYDPTYARAIARQFARIESSLTVVPAGVDDADFQRLAAALDGELARRVPDPEPA